MFPQTITLDEALEAINGKTEFKLYSSFGFTFIKYQTSSSSTFPDLSTASNKKQERHLKILRECRGIAFNQKTGKCVCRKFHKFFNINEKEETNVSLKVK